MRLALDHHYSPVIAENLRAGGHDVVAAIEHGWHLAADEELLGLCTVDGRALLTNDVRDFVLVARRWAAEGRSHAGLVFRSDTSLPRTRTTIGRYVDALEDMLRAHPSPDAFTDRVHWP